MNQEPHNSPLTATRTLKLYKPHRGQLAMHESKKRFRIGVWGRQAGKSTWGNQELARAAWTHPHSIHWFLGQTHDAAKVQFRRAKDPLHKSGALLDFNLSELKLQLQSHGSIFYKSGKVLEDLRGETLNSAMTDEVRNQHKDLWPLVIRPMLTTTKGRGSFISTPNGFDQLFDLVEYAKENPNEWEVFHFPSTINPLFTLEEYEAAKRTMSDKQFRQEIEAEFVDMSAGRVYYSFGEHNLKTQNPFTGEHPLINPWMPIVLGLDFNVNPMSWALGQCNNTKWHWFNEIYLENSNTQEATLELVTRLSEWREQGLLRAEPQLIICGDASGKARQRAASGKSDYDIVKGILKEKDFTFDDITPDDNPGVKDRVNAVNAMLKSAFNNVSITIDPVNCPKLKRDLQRVVWKDGSNIIDKNKDTSLTHMSDAFGYPIHKLTPVKEIEEVGVLRIIQN